LSEPKIEERLFGTDGIRGKAGEGWLSADAVARLGRAIGIVLGAEVEAGSKRALVGQDGRRSGPELEAALACGLASQGFEILSAGLITTPGLALLTRLLDFDLGVMISASHNPAEDNGIKIFGAGGEKLADELEDRIEGLLRADQEPCGEGARPQLDPELENAYLKNLLETVPELKLDGLVIALDCANGAGSRVAPRILGRLGAHVLPVACSPDGDNINDNCGSTHPSQLQEAVRSNGAHLGIALDGDGDRCLLVDENGALVNGDAILTLLARNAAKYDRLADPRIVATVMSNRGLHRALRDVGVEVVTVGVGDRQVVDALRRERIALGGEQSGHIVFGGDHHYIGDGIYTALRVLQAMREEKSPLSELAAAYSAFPQVLINVPVDRKPNLADVPTLVDAVRRVEDHWGEDGRVLLRYSGTEPLARVMVEGPDEQEIRAQAEQLAKLIAKEIGS
jgi:phosphoglucosamine mutase